MKLGKMFVLTGAFLVMTNIANAKLPGYTEGAEIMRPKIENGQIDSMSGIIYSQIKGLRSNRALRMTVMIPRDGKAKPAIIYFPGGGFTSADHEKFTEMRTALAKAGFVVAAAEYRTVPTKYPAIGVIVAPSAVRALIVASQKPVFVSFVNMPKSTALTQKRLVYLATLPVATLLKCPERPTVKSSLIKATF